VSAERKRRIALASLLVAVAVAAVLVVSDPFGAPAKPSGVADNATTTSLVTVRRQALSSQMQVNATLGYAGASSIRVPSGTAPSAVRQAQQSVSSSEGMLSTARASLAADSATLANVRATLLAAREKESVDCAGDGPAENASAQAAGAGPSSSGGASGACAGDVQALAGDEQSSNGEALKLSGDRRSVVSARAALASARAAARTVRSTAADYEQGSTFTMLARVGQRIARGGDLFALGGAPTVLLYGTVVPWRAFLVGMSPGGDVAELNANLHELGYGGGLSGDTFSAATEAAIRAFQLAHGMTATGELPLGSVAFERGPVLVTSVTPEVGASVAPGPVLGIASTVAQVSIALSAAQQSSVKVGDRVSIALPNNVTTPGVVSSVGTVAKAPASKEGGGGGENEEGGATIEVDVTPSDPSATAHLDEAPVTVSITTASVRDALVAPIDALLALAGGGYALEVSEGGVHRLEAVTLGLFDDAEGLVQVGGASVLAGQRVVVPAS
jgi:peptidoglycan hydrolase-like protein with peptidoglycan-binding domain